MEVVVAVVAVVVSSGGISAQLGERLLLLLARKMVLDKKHWASQWGGSFVVAGNHGPSQA